jgi:predicted dithiol-disulfide oxidoreductase (DUF899 family)
MTGMHRKNYAIEILQKALQKITSAKKKCPEDAEYIEAWKKLLKEEKELIQAIQALDILTETK